MLSRRGLRRAGELETAEVYVLVYVLGYVALLAVLYGHPVKFTR